MNWLDFLDKLRSGQKAGMKLGVNIGALTKLIFAGAFNGMIKELPEYSKMPAWQRCVRMADETTKALKSTGKLPKRTKNEPIGLNEINNDVGLVLWRHMANPLFTHNLTTLYPEHMRMVFGFEANKRGNTQKVPMVKEPADGRAGTDLLSAFIYAFESAAMSAAYKKGQRNAAVMGIIVKTEARKYQGHKKFLSVTFFDGYHEYDVTLWPPFGASEFNQATAAALKPCAYGLFVIKPDLYKGKRGGTLVKFYDMIV